MDRRGIAQCPYREASRVIAELILFIIFGGTALAMGVGMVTARNAIHSAMFLVVNFFCMAVLFLVLNAQFVAVIQILVYAGAIMVLFVFVIMLLNATGIIEARADELKYNRAVGALFCLFLLGEGAAIIATGLFQTPAASTTPLQGTALLNFGTPKSIGQLLFTRYLLPFEVTSVLLLIAMVGALVIGKRRLT
jgi:NADH-quinone oxidoreductase subunit J